MARALNVAPGFAKQLFDLSGKVALVTGGASGLGEAMALGLAQAGASVIAADVRSEAIQDLLQALHSRDERIDGAVLDVTDKASVEAAVERVTRDHGHIDVLVNSAGTAARHPAEHFPEEVWDRVVTLNLKGTFLPAQAVGRRMLDRGSGSIINIASIGASVAYPFATAYLQSKGGVAQMTRSLALEWAARGVRVNAIAPSLFDTPLARAGDSETNVTSDFIMARTPMGRRGRPEEIVGPAIFLASDASSMVTGHILQVDGGYLSA